MVSVCVLCVCVCVWVYTRVYRMVLNTKAYVWDQFKYWINQKGLKSIGQLGSVYISGLDLDFDWWSGFNNQMKFLYQDSDISSLWACIKFHQDLFEVFVFNGNIHNI